MDHVALHTAALERTAGALVALLRNLPPEAAAWRPRSGTWSPLEIACHLLDEEREDFRVRLDYTLHRPGETWPSIDPPGWVTAHRYAEQDLTATIEALRIERERSLAWLRGLAPPDWDAAYEHPLLGTLRAGDLMAAWAGHDLLHLRQLARRQWEYLAAHSRPYDASYAGDW